MSDAQNNVENTNTIWHLMHVTAISTSCTHGIRSGVQMPQITKYEFVKIKLSSNHPLYLKTPKGQHHESRLQIFPN